MSPVSALDRPVLRVIVLLAALGALLLISVRPASATSFRVDIVASVPFGESPSGIAIELISPATGGTVHSATTNTSGLAVFPSVAEGTYTLRATPPAGHGLAITLDCLTISDFGSGASTLSYSVAVESGDTPNGVPCPSPTATVTP